MSTSQQLFSNITSAGTLEFTLQDVEIAEPKAHEVVVKMQAAPINPSDMWPMFGPADLRAAELADDGKTLTAAHSPRYLAAYEISFGHGVANW